MITPPYACNPDLQLFLGISYLEQNFAEWESVWEDTCDLISINWCFFNDCKYYSKGATNFI